MMRADETPHALGSRSNSAGETMRVQFVARKSFGPQRRSRRPTPPGRTLPLDAAQASVGQVMRGAATLGCHRAGHPHLPWRGPVGRQSMIRNARLQPPVWLWEPNAGVSFWAIEEASYAN